MDKAELVKKHTNNGFTLVELLITLAIFMILITVAIPSFSALIERSSISSTINLLRDSHAYARLEAVKRQQTIQICRINAVTGGCTGASREGAFTWNDGLLIFIDADGDRLYAARSDDELLKLVDFPASVQVTWNNGENIWLNAEGRSAAGTFSVFTQTLGAGQALIISPTGRVRTER